MKIKHQLLGAAIALPIMYSNASAQDCEKGEFLGQISSNPCYRGQELILDIISMSVCGRASNHLQIRTSNSLGLSRALGLEVNNQFPPPFFGEAGGGAKSARNSGMRCSSQSLRVSTNPR